MPIVPVDFEDGSINDESQFEDVVDEVMGETESSPEPVSSTTIDSRMAEMEERLETIQYYKLLMNGGFFNNPPNQVIAQKIEQEVANFILTRLDALLNMGVSKEAPKAVSQFGDEEVKALKSLAEPNTHKVLTEVVSRVFSKITKNEEKKPAKAEVPKLTQKAVPQEAPKKQVVTPPAMSVKAKAAPQAKQAAPTKNPEPVAAPAPQAPVVPGRQKKHFKSVTRINQQTGEPMPVEGKVEVTPQARPLGPIQPVSVPTNKSEIESRMEMSARRSSGMGLNIFDQKLSNS